MHAVWGNTVRYEAIYRLVNLLLFIAAQLILTELMLVALRVIIVQIGIERFILLFYTFNLEVPYTMLEVQIALSGTSRKTHPWVVIIRTFFNLFLVPVIDLIYIVEAKFGAKLEK